MKEDRDILDDFLEDSGLDVTRFSCEVSKDGTTATIINMPQEIIEMTEEQEAKAKLYALSKLNTTREAFLIFGDKTEENKTFNILSAAIVSFADFANGIVEFIMNPPKTEEEYDETELSEYIMYGTAKAIIEEFIIECHKELTDEFI